MHKEHYLRGRTMEDLEKHLRDGLSHVGAHAEASHETELDGLRGLLDVAHDGDVVAVMTHSHQAELHAWLLEHGATTDGPREIRRKVRAARGSGDAPIDSVPDEARDDVRIAIDALERAASHDTSPSVFGDMATSLKALLESP